MVGDIGWPVFAINSARFRQLVARLVLVLRASKVSCKTGRRMSTFLDFKLPLTERLEKLALLIGSNEWSPDMGPYAESLIRETIMCLSSLLAESKGRNSVLDGLTNWNNDLRVENMRLRQEVNDLQLALFDEAKRSCES